MQKQLKINWQRNGSNSYRAYIGNVTMCCFLCNRLCDYVRKFNIADNTYWRTVVSMYGHTKKGRERKTLARAKEDGADLVQKLLLDYYYSIIKEMKRFNLFIER